MTEIKVSRPTIKVNTGEYQKLLKALDVLASIFDKMFKLSAKQLRIRFLKSINALNLMILILVIQRAVSVCIKSTIKRLLLLKPVIRDYIRHSIVINRFDPYKLSALREWNHVT